MSYKIPKSVRKQMALEASKVSQILTAKRKRLLDKHYFQWSFCKPDEFVPDKTILDNCSHPAELHYIANNYNWDDGVLVLTWILESSLCSKSTANMLFWRSLPSYFENSNFDDLSTCPEWCEDGFIIIKKVLAKYEKNDFSHINVPYDPENEIEQVQKNNEYWSIPDEVYEAISI